MPLHRKGGGDSQLGRGFAGDSPGIRRLRATRLDGGNVLQVFNPVAFPETDRQQPPIGH